MNRPVIFKEVKEGKRLSVFKEEKGYTVKLIQDVMFTNEYNITSFTVPDLKEAEFLVSVLEKYSSFTSNYKG